MIDFKTMPGSMEIDGEIIERVDQYLYLGNMIYYNQLQEMPTLF